MMKQCSIAAAQYVPALTGVRRGRSALMVFSRGLIGPYRGSSPWRAKAHNGSDRDPVTRLRQQRGSVFMGEILSWVFIRGNGQRTRFYSSCTTGTTNTNSTVLSGNTGIDHVWSFGARGTRVRQRVAIFGGIHGNELVGINVVRRLVADFEEGRLRFGDGDLDSNGHPDGVNTAVVLTIGNPQACALGKRASSKGADLNREFTVDVLEESRRLAQEKCTDSSELPYERRRALELSRVLARSDYLVDLHATNHPSPPFVRIGGFVSEERLELASWFIGIDNPEAPAATRTLLLHDPTFQIGCGITCTTDEFSTAMGNVAVCVETGLANDTSMEDEVYLRVVSLLGHMAGVTQQGINGWEQAGVLTPVRVSAVEDNDRTLQETVPRFGMQKIVLESDTGDNMYVLPQRYPVVFDTFELQPPRIQQHEDDFDFAPGFGKRNWELVPAGVCPDKVSKEDKVKMSKDSDKNIAKRQTFQEPMMLVFPKAKGSRQTGKPVYWLAKPCGIDMFNRSSTLTTKLTQTTALQSHLKNVRKQNRDYFIPMMLKRPVAFDKKKGESKLQLKTSGLHRWDERSTFLGASDDNVIPPIGHLKVKTLTPVTANTMKDTGFAIPHVLRALQEWLDNPMGSSKKKNANKRRALPSAAKQMCYVPPSTDVRGENGEKSAPGRPILVFPSSYVVNQDFFRKGMAPFYSPRLVLPAMEGVRRIQRKGKMYLGLPKAANSNFDLSAPEHKTTRVIEYDGAIFAPITLAGSAYFLTVLADTPAHETCLVVVGDNVQDVGRSYHSLAKAAQTLFAIAGEDGKAAEYLPIISSLGETVSWYGTKQFLDEDVSVASIQQDPAISTEELDFNLKHCRQPLNQHLRDEEYSFDY